MMIRENHCKQMYLDSIHKIGTQTALICEDIAAHFVRGRWPPTEYFAVAPFFPSVEKLTRCEKNAKSQHFFCYSHSNITGGIEFLSVTVIYSLVS